MRKMQAGPLLSLSPSFNSYSSSTGNLADIAARVVSEFRRENSGSDAAFYLEDDDVDHLWFHAELDQRRPLDHHRDDHDRDDDVGDDDDDDGEEENEFEFAFVCREPTASPISADEIFYNGQIKPVYYPLFGKNLILEESPGTDAVVVSGTDGKNDKSAVPPPPPPPRRRQQLRMLMVEEEREATTSCSWSEADELDRLQHGTYCVWKPRNGGAAAGGKKSKSTGTSKRWKFRDLLGRSFNSDRKDRGTIVVIAAPGKKVVSKSDKVTGKGTAVAAGKTEAKNDVVSTTKKAGKEEDKRRSYKQDLVGFLANVNGLSRNLHPF